MQNMSPLAYTSPRRSSAAGLGLGSDHQGASVANGYRSHSVDGLLDQAAAAASSSSQDSLSTPDQRIAAAAAVVTAGSTALTNASSTCTLQPEDEAEADADAAEADMVDMCIVTRRDKQHLAPASVQQHRKSRSLDHILSKQTLAELLPATEPTDETQSMQNLALPPTPQPQRRDTSSSSKSPTPERPQRAGAYSRRSPDGVSSTESEREDARASLRSQSSASGNQQRAAAHVHRGGSLNSNKTSNSSLGSNNSAGNKTIFNRTMKKVRSLMKK